MMRAESLLLGAVPVGNVPPPESDPLRQPDPLLETQLLDVRVRTLVSTVGLLFELRTAMEFPGAGDAAFLVARGVREFTWSAEPPAPGRLAWTVLGSVPLPTDGLFTLELVFFPDALLRLTAKSADFYVADLPELVPRIPDYGTDDEKTIKRGLSAWESPLSLVGASSLSCE